MEADALEVGWGKHRQDGRREMFRDDRAPAAGLSASRIASTAERASWRSPRTPIRYMTASMMAQARLQPSIPMSTARTSARLASVAVEGQGEGKDHDQAEQNLACTRHRVEHAVGRGGERRRDLAPR